MNLQLLITCLFLFVGSMVFARLVTDTAKEKLDRVFRTVEVIPSFKGGPEALHTYLNETVETDSPQEGEEGTVTFIVSEKENIYEVQFIDSDLSFQRSLAKALSKSSGMWNSALVNDIPVHAYFTLKVSYRDGKIWGEVPVHLF